MVRLRSTLRAVPSRVWAAVAGLVVIASLSIAAVLGAGLQVWQGAVGGQPSALPPGLTQPPHSGLVTVPTPLSPHRPARRATAPPAVRTAPASVAGVQSVSATGRSLVVARMLPAPAASPTAVTPTAVAPSAAGPLTAPAVAPAVVASVPAAVTLPSGPAHRHRDLEAAVARAAVTFRTLVAAEPARRRPTRHEHGAHPAAHAAAPAASAGRRGQGRHVTRAPSRCSHGHGPGQHTRAARREGADRRHLHAAKGRR